MPVAMKDLVPSSGDKELNKKLLAEPFFIQIHCNQYWGWRLSNLRSLVEDIHGLGNFLIPKNVASQPLLLHTPCRISVLSTSTPWYHDSLLQPSPSFGIRDVGRPHFWDWKISQTVEVLTKDLKFPYLQSVVFQERICKGLNLFPITLI